MTRKRVVISGGGTGGHIYPALEVGRKLEEKAPFIEVTFIGSSRGVEKKIMDRHGARFIPLKIEGLKGKGLKGLKSLFLLPFSFLKSLAILLRLKPDLVIGAGGYSSGPVVWLATAMKIPTLLLEQNVRPGLTNRLLVPRVSRAAVSFRSSLPFFKGKGVFTGNPVREAFSRLLPKERNETLTLLIFGGSQGSRFLNKALTSTLPLLREEKEKLRIFHQTGENDLKWVKDRYAENGFDEAVVSPYFHDMPDFFRKADLIISRAGATTVAELTAARKAAILMPFAEASDDHQTLNARELETAGGAEVIPEKEFTPRLLADRILFYMRNKEAITRMEKNLVSLKTENAAEKIAGICLELMGIRTQGTGG